MNKHFLIKNITYIRILVNDKIKLKLEGDYVMNDNQSRITIRKRGDDGYRIFSIRIPEATAARIDQIANDTNRSRNEIIGILLDWASERCDII